MVFDAYGQPLKAEELDVRQNEEYSNPGEKSISDKQAVPEPNPLTVVVESSEKDSKEHKTEYQHNHALQWEALRVQRRLFWATLAAFGAAAYYAWVAKQQLITMNETLEEAHIQNVAQQRALLSVDGDSIPLRSGDVGIRIRNKGRMVGKVLSYQMKYEQFRPNSASLVREKNEQINFLVAPEEPSTLSFTPPDIPPSIRGEIVYIRLDINIAYDDGFGTTQHISQCLSYNIAHDVWEQSCLSTYAIDLSKSLPNDIWLPPKTKK